MLEGKIEITSKSQCSLFANTIAPLSPSSTFSSFYWNIRSPSLTQQLKNFSNLILAQSFINLDEQISKFWAIR